MASVGGWSARTVKQPSGASETSTSLSRAPVGRVVRIASHERTRSPEARLRGGAATAESTSTNEGSGSDVHA